MPDQMKGVREKSRRLPRFLVWVPEWITMPLSQTGNKGGGWLLSSPHGNAGNPTQQPLSAFSQ